MLPPARFALAALCALSLTGCARSGFRAAPDAGRDAGLDAGADAGAGIDAALADAAGGGVDAATLPRGDFNGDGCIDCADAALLRQQLELDLADLRFDLNDDGAVDLLDVALLAQRMGLGCTGPLAANLEVWGTGFEPYLEMTLHGALTVLTVDDLVTLFSARIEGATFQTEQPGVLFRGEQHRLDAFVDVDGDLRCGRDDLVWALDFSASDCLTKVELIPAAGEQYEACSSFAITADFTGDGCVDEADFDIFEAEFGGSGPDLVADFNGDGMVTALDFAVFLRNFRLGCPAVDGGMPDASALFDAGVAEAGADLDGGAVEAGLDHDAAVDAALRDAEIVATDAFRPEAAVDPFDAAAADAGNLAELVWVRIPRGSFDMGCALQDMDCTAAELPRHPVEVIAFELTRTPITQGQYESRTGANPSAFVECGPSCPVEQVSWNDAASFCQAIGGRLPSEAEWEYAARGNSTGIWSCGFDQTCVEDIAWYGQSANLQTHPVGEKAPNGFGLYDMFGNVSEWLEDCWHIDYTGAPSDGSAWLGDLGGDCSFRVQRGGDWASMYPVLLRASMRNHTDPSLALDRYGFRCAR